jgi:ADP-heptose:LPS heptosyltransferase
VVHLGSGLALKEWPLARWRELASLLVAEGHQLVFTGSGGDQAEKVRAAIADQPGCVDLCDKLSWAEFVATVSGARLVVTVDSVAGHLAAAAGTPVVVLMTGMNRIPQWQPFAERVAVVTHSVPCAPCHTSWGCEAMSCIREVDVASVLEAVHAQLEAAPVSVEGSESLSRDRAFHQPAAQ